MKKLATAFALACALLAVTVPAASADFGIESFDGEVINADGSPATQAGSHPYEAWTTIKFNQTTEENGFPVPDGNFRTIETMLPAGLVGDPGATPRCSAAEFFAGEPLEQGECSDAAAVGMAELFSTLGSTFYAPVYNLDPGPDQVGRFGFHLLSASIILNASVRTGGDYGLNIEIPNNSQGLPISGTTLRLWGVPSDPSHDAFRGECLGPLGPTGSECESRAAVRPFLTNPTSCVGPVATGMRANSWQQSAVWHEASFLSHDGEGHQLGADGCDQLPFEPSLDVRVQPGRAASPSSLDVHVHVPQHDGAEELATAHLKKAVVALPEGVTVNAAAASGLGACSASQIGIDDRDPVNCPDSAKIGSAEIVSPLVDEPLKGAVYLAKQGENPFGTVLAAYLVVSAKGVLVKLPLRIDADAASGQVTATVDNGPQLPFSDVDLSFTGGDRGVLVAPQTCGTYTANGTIAPWSGTPPVAVSSSFEVKQGPGGGTCTPLTHSPGFSAGTTNPTAGRYSPFVLNLSREDGSQALTGLSAKLPPGLLAKLKGIPYCAEGALAAIPLGAGDGAAQLASPSCPAQSQVGSVAVTAGAGGSPFFLDTGRVYLAGPYKGAPLSLAIVTPALAGPFDLGNVVVRAALDVDPSTAQVEATTDPIPTILSGIPLNLRSIRLRIDRNRFTLNPTSCDPTSVEGTVSGAAGGSASVSSRFQVGSCGSLGFAPRLALNLSGGTKRGDHPKLRAVLRPRPNQANLAKVVVTLPHSEFLEQSHIAAACTRVQFAAADCPAASVYGTAVAQTPLLDKPLRGPVYLRSGKHELPDLVAALHGQIDITLSGRIDSVRGGRMRATFDVVPDAPLSRFVLSMKGGSKGLLVNSRDLCGAPARAAIQTEAHNGKVRDTRTPLVSAGCK
jgi:hypothetical protein